nr:hypothetical protein [Tanacetum cinerariifolium]
FTEVKTTSTSMETQKPLLKDEDGKEVNVHMYRYQVNPKISHLHAVKRIFRYLKGQPKLGIWYPKDSPFDLVAYTDSDYAGASLDRMSTTGGVGRQFGRAATTAFSLEAEQDNGNINKTQSKATPNESSSQGIDSGGGPRCQEAMRDTTAQTRFQSLSKLFNDSLLVRGNTLQSDEDRMKLNELIELCTNLQTRVLDLEKIKTTKSNEIASLKRRVKKLEKRNRSRTHKLKRLYKVGLTARVESSDDEASLEQEVVKDVNENVVEEVDNAAQDSSRRARAFKRVSTFKEFRQELVERKEKSAGEELIQESTKKPKVDDDKEKAKLKQLKETIPDEEEVDIDVIPLVVKSPRIVD